MGEEVVTKVVSAAVEKIIDEKKQVVEENEDGEKVETIISETSLTKEDTKTTEESEKKSDESDKVEDKIETTTETETVVSTNADGKEVKEKRETVVTTNGFHEEEHQKDEQVKESRTEESEKVEESSTTFQASNTEVTADIDLSKKEDQPEEGLEQVQTEFFKQGKQAAEEVVIKVSES